MIGAPAGSRLFVTAAIEEKMRADDTFASFIVQCLRRHLTGDWGDLDAEDEAVNDAALGDRSRILSVYKHATLPKLWIITDAGWAVTTVLFPDDY